MAWTSADLAERFYLYMGRGNGGTFGPDELWTAARVYLILGDAYEQVLTDCAPVAPDQFMSAPVRLETADGGKTYTWPDGAYPFGHAEVYAKESGTIEHYASTYGDCGDRESFVIEGAKIRAPGNRARAFTLGPYGRAVFMPARLAADVDPTMVPEAARELILWRALVLAAEVSNGEMDPLPWMQKYGDAKDRWFRTWATQYATRGQAARAGDLVWWRSIDWSQG